MAPAPACAQAIAHKTTSCGGAAQSATADAQMLISPVRRRVVRARERREASAAAGTWDRRALRRVRVF